MTDPIKPGVAIGDMQYVARGGAILWPLQMGTPVKMLLPDLPQGWTLEKDRLLRATVRLAPMWGAALGKAAAAIAAADWTVEDTDDSSRRVKAAQDLLHRFDGGGWAGAIERHYRDYETTMNGAHIRILRQFNARGARVTGLLVLDSLRCWRTADLQYPIMYQRLDGGVDYLRDWEVFSIAAMPDPDAEHIGMGLCGAERAYRRIQLEAAMDLYDYEKLTGSGATKLILLKGVMDETLQNILLSADAERKMKNLIAYMGAIIGTSLDDGDLQVVEIDLKSAPDGFDREAERTHTAAVYGNVLNMPISEVAPLREGLGAGGQARASAEQNAGDSRAVYKKKLIHAINHFVLPTSTTFAWSTNDTADKKAKAEANKVEIDSVLAMVDKGVLNANQARQMFVDKGIVPREFLTGPDQTPGGQVTDTQKVMDDPAPPPPAGAQPAQRPAPVVQAVTA